MFHRDSFDGQTKGDGVGGIMSKGYKAWSDFQRDNEWFRKYQRFVKLEIKRLGKKNVYDKLTGKDVDKFKKIVEWIEKEEILLVKRGDYKQWQVY